MRTARFAALLLLSLCVAAPALAGGKPVLMGTVVQPVLSDGVAANTLGNFNITTSQCICEAFLGQCNTRNTFDANTLFFYNMYFTDVSTGGLQGYLVDLGFAEDTLHVTLINDGGVTFNLSGIAPGESFMGCVYVQFIALPRWKNRFVTTWGGVTDGFEVLTFTGNPIGATP